MRALKKDIYQHFATLGIYLPSYQLDKLIDEIYQRNKESILKLLDEFENRPELKQFTKASLGAYSLRDIRQDNGILPVQKVKQLDADGNIIAEYESQYEAAKALGKKKGEGNIRRAAKTGVKAYGYNWKFC